MGLHIVHSRSFWCMPLLIWEVWVLTASSGFVLHGFLRTMMMLDAQSPILSWGAFVRLLRREFRRKRNKSGNGLKDETNNLFSDDEGFDAKARRSSSAEVSSLPRRRRTMGDASASPKK